MYIYVYIHIYIDMIQARRHPRPPAAKHRGAELRLGPRERRGGLLHWAGAHASCALLNVE